MQKQCPRRPFKAGFTLMEVLLVLVILVVLGSFAVTQFTGIQDLTNRQTAETQVNLIDDAATKFKFSMNKFPTSVEELMVAPSDAKPGRWAGPYLDKKPGLDPWDNPYQYAYPGKHNSDKPDIWSNGPDGTSGSEDDIGNWETNT